MAAKKNPPTVPDAQPPDPYPAPVPDPGWWRNAGETAVHIVGDGVGAILHPGRITHLPWAPSHRQLAPATRVEYEAQQAADEPAGEPAPPAPGGFVSAPDGTPATPDPTPIQE